jgi:transcription elongation GreA/GreB family factor
MIDKKAIIAEILKYLTLELNKAQIAAQQAKAAATDEQSKAETKYDTLAIEASYLAEGQAKRVQEFQQAINRLSAFSSHELSPQADVGLGSLVQLAADADSHHWFFLSPVAGGFRVLVNEQQITVLTKESPMGQSLLAKNLHDDVTIKIGPTSITDTIVNLQ